MKMDFTKITEIAAKLSFTAVIADLFYIIYRIRQPVTDFEDAAFMYAVPEMLELMLLCVVIIAAFLAMATYIEVRSNSEEGRG